LTTNSDILYQEIVSDIFPDYAKGESRKMMPAIAPANYIEAINAIDLPIDFKLQISLFFGNFNYAVSVLAIYLKRVYLLVDELYNEYKREIALEYDQIQSTVNLELYKNKLQCDEEYINNASVSVSLLNQYIVYEKKSTENELVLLLGLRHEEVISEHVDESKGTAENFILTCGSEVRMKIVKVLIDKKEMTSSQIAKYIDIPVTTMIRHISTLQKNGIIYVSRRDKLQIFYRLNDKLLRRIKIDIDNMFSNILNIERKVNEDNNENN
jgi:DNA-binding transcriptional ArsR family regulator